MWLRSMMGTLTHSGFTLIADHLRRVWREGCLCVSDLIHSSAKFCTFGLRISLLEGRSCRTAWASVVRHPGVMLALLAASISGMPMPAPGLTRWVTSATHLLAFVWEATWPHSHSYFRSGLELRSRQDCKWLVCPHLYPFSFCSSYKDGGTTLHVLARACSMC